MKKKVSDCNNCPFLGITRDGEYYWCNHQSANKALKEGMKGPVTPEWCPLKKESITISFVNQ